MLFGYFSDPIPESGDVLELEADIHSLHFDRPLYAGSELYYAGALAFALSYGFGGRSIAEWASLDVSLDGASVVELEPELFDWLVTMARSQRAALRS
jgi:hypothetical protein